MIDSTGLFIMCGGRLEVGGMRGTVSDEDELRARSKISIGKAKFAGKLTV
jgi:hypothetical protein